jgi:hypothetical protein
MCLRLRWIRSKMPASLILLSLLALFLVGCGTDSSTTSGSSSTTTTAAATATACAQNRPATSFKTVDGTLKSSSATTLVVATQQGTVVSVTYSSSTRFTRQDTVPASSLKEGSSVTVAVTSVNNGYTATRISLTSGSTNGNSPFPRGTAIAGNNPCFSVARRSGSFVGGQFGGTGTGTNGSNFRGLVGTVSQLNGDILTITDSSGTDYTVTITSQTQITQTSTVNPATLKAGMALLITDSVSSNGTITARSVTIVSKLPTTGNGTPAQQ